MLGTLRASDANASPQPYNKQPSCTFDLHLPQLLYHVHKNRKMAPRKKVPQESESEDSSDDQSQDLESEEPPKIEPYTVLGLEKTATEDEIKKAYRKAALQHHPGMLQLLLPHAHSII